MKNTPLKFNRLRNLYLLLTVVLSSGSISYSQTLISFQEVLNTPFQAVYESSIAFADIDNDSDKDLLITGRSSGSSHISRLYLNNGFGLFTNDSASGLAGASNSSVAFADIDLDNDLDLLITGQNSGSPLVIISKLYSNNGSGVFTLLSGTPFTPVQNSSVAFADLDGNNTFDLVLTGENVGSNYQTELYLNDSIGNFTPVPNAFSQGVRFSSIAFADVDGDNDKDLMVTGLEFNNPSSVYVAKLFLNNGSGLFTELFGTPFQGVAYSSVAFADVDGDNDQDLFISGGTSGSGKSSALYINDGIGNFSLSSQLFTGVNKASIAFSDIDNDNDPDLLITGEASSVGRIAELYKNDGLGNFTIVTGLPFAGVGNGSVAFADVNGDTKPDLVITGENAGAVYVSKLYLNTSLFTNIENIEIGSKITVYPNITSDMVHINIGAAIIKSIKLFNLQGQLIREFMTNDFSVSDLTAGVYFIKIQTNNVTETLKIVKY